MGLEPSQQWENVSDVIIHQFVGHQLTDMGFYFIMFLLLPSHWGFFVFGHEISLFGGFQQPSVGGASTASFNFGALTGGDDCMSFYSVMLNQKLEFNFKK